MVKYPWTIIDDRLERPGSLLGGDPGDSLKKDKGDLQAPTRPAQPFPLIRIREEPTGMSENSFPGCMVK